MKYCNEGSEQDETGFMKENEPEISNDVHDLFLQKNGSHYESPIMFEGGMDIDECEMYYMLMDAQQNGGVSRPRKESHSVPPRALVSTSKIAPISILKKPRYTKPNETSFAPPRFVRRFSFSNHDTTRDNSKRYIIGNLRRSNSMGPTKAPRVSFHRNLYVATIHAIDDIPYDVRKNLWMSSDELSICMHEAAIARMEEEMANRRKQLDEEQVKVERRNSSTSVIDGDDESFL